jgi:7,8-dihydropterin-6-yl-methyl-4-(beta-D-ribofuranosyl)aminobenzene 5'-phosphate synthase
MHARRYTVCLLISIAALLLSGAIASLRAQGVPAAGAGEVTLTIVYDNNPHDKRLKTAWGFGCVVRGLPKTILFDTGGKGQLLLDNMKKLDVKPDLIDAVVLSHYHGDHVGGLDAFLKQNSDVTVFLPAAFPQRFKQTVRKAGAKLVETEKPTAVCAGACTTGVLGAGIKEQGLYVETADGIMVITGCAHPGIVSMTAAAKKHSGKRVLGALGGFHMTVALPGEITAATQSLKRLGARRVGPCHCSGDRARRMMKKAFGEGCMELGVGARITFPRRKETQPRGRE